MAYPFVATPVTLSSQSPMFRMIAEHAWEQTILGDQTSWPVVLRTTVSLILESSVPMVTLWGDTGIMLYNDAYVAFAGARHPYLLGQPVREGWPEVEDFVDEVVLRVMAGETLSFREHEMALYRNGHPTQVWMDLDFSPIVDDDNRVLGILGIVVETTEKYRSHQHLTLGRKRLMTMFEQAPGFMAMLSGPSCL